MVKRGREGTAEADDDAVKPKKRNTGIKDDEPQRQAAGQQSSSSQRPQHIYATIARELRVTAKQVSSTATLLDAGNTLPFIARYRKEATGSLDEVQLRAVAARLTTLDNLESRRATVLSSLQAAGVADQAVIAAVQAADTLQKVEDLYLPYRPKRSSRASAAREKGLGPLADAILQGRLSGKDGTLATLAAPFVKSGGAPSTAQEALAGANDIIAERAAEVAEARERARQLLQQHGRLVSKLSKSGKQELAKEAGEDGAAADASKPAPKEAKKKPAAAGAKQAKGKRAASVHTYEIYFNFAAALKHLRPHQVLALNRGEAQGHLSLALEWDLQPVCHTAQRALLRTAAGQQAQLPGPRLDFVAAAVRDGAERLLRPAVEREVRSSATQAAEQHAVRVFGRNLRALLLAPPLPATVVLGIDPAYRTGCKAAVVSGTGGVLETAVLQPHPPAAPEQRRQAGATLLDLVRRHGVQAVAIGNGTASQETEAFVARTLLEAGVSGGKGQGRSVGWCVVSEAGASVYSASELAAAELPGMDVSLRGAVSIARRLQDPMAELVKVDPQHVGVGLYQHDVKAKSLEEQCGHVVESAVNAVGVELNSASPALLARVAGLNRKVAAAIVTQRDSAGPFASRQQLAAVKGLGPKTFEQCAGFLRIAAAPNALDATSVHPERYAEAAALVRALAGAGAVKPAAAKAGKGRKKTSAELGSVTATQLDAAKPRLRALLADSAELARRAGELGLGEVTLRDVAEALASPGRDVRTEAPPPPLRHSATGSVADLKVGMELQGVVRNVVDFGAFVDMNVGRDGLLHVSAIAEALRNSGGGSGGNSSWPMDGTSQTESNRRGNGSSGAGNSRPPRVDVHEVLSVGDVVMVRVLSVDVKAQKIGLAPVPESLL